mmetsp:Transcript_3685/g.4047  ORF Transcript_3685/g.4047 Transcript_3685/m.4047 type:complete len:87 (+) Transcript_3685:399-659(+)
MIDNSSSFSTVPTQNLSKLFILPLEAQKIFFHHEFMENNSEQINQNHEIGVIFIRPLGFFPSEGLLSSTRIVKSHFDLGTLMKSKH